MLKTNEKKQKKIGLTGRLEKVKRKDLEQIDARQDHFDEEMFEGLLRTPQVGSKRSTFCAYHKGVTPVPRLQRLILHDF